MLFYFNSICAVYIPGHGDAPHSAVSIESPSQFVPPYLGVGLLQPLDLSLTPPPQDTGHSDQFVQSDQPPLTVTSTVKFEINAKMLL